MNYYYFISYYYKLKFTAFSIDKQTQNFIKNIYFSNNCICSLSWWTQLSCFLATQAALKRCLRPDQVRLRTPLRARTGSRTRASSSRAGCSWPSQSPSSCPRAANSSGSWEPILIGTKKQSKLSFFLINLYFIARRN